MILPFFATTTVLLLQLATGAGAAPTKLSLHGSRVGRRTGHSNIAARQAGGLPLETYAVLSARAEITDPQYAKLTEMKGAVLQMAVDISHASWEIGTITETLLELDHPHLTPFGWSDVLDKKNVPTQMLRIIANKLNEYKWDGAPQPNSEPDLRKYINNNVPRPIQNDASIADSASMGMASYILAYFADVAGDIGGPGRSRDEYAWVAGNQYAFLKQSDQREGVISHRSDGYTLWSDEGYMIPPFFAYLGLASHNRGLLEDALYQWTGISNGLLDGATGLWRHQNPGDDKIWLTGNGWMLMGLMRVIASIRASRFDINTSDAENIAARAFKSLFDSADSEGIMQNVLGDNTQECAGTAGVVAAFYRFLVINPGLAEPMKAQAEKSFGGLVNKIDDQGKLMSVVDPSGGNGFNMNDGRASPEGQAFIMLMWAARTAAGQ